MRRFPAIGLEGQAYQSQVSELMGQMDVYGILYNSENSATQSLTAATPATLEWVSNGEYRSVTVDAANERIAIEVPGHYMTMFQASFKGATGVTQMRLAVNGTADSARCERYESSPSNPGSAGFLWIGEFDSGDLLTIEIEVAGNSTFTLIQGQLLVKRIF